MQPFTQIVPLPDNPLEVLAFLGSGLRGSGQVLIFGGQLVIFVGDRGQFRPQLGDRLIVRSRPDGPIAFEVGHLRLGHGQLVPDSACPQRLFTRRNLYLMLRSTQSILKSTYRTILIRDLLFELELLHFKYLNTVLCFKKWVAIYLYLRALSLPITTLSFSLRTPFGAVLRISSCIQWKLSTA